MSTKQLIKRHKTRQVKVGDIYIGGQAPVSVQSMTKTDTRDVKATVAQIKELEKEGCEIIRSAVVDMEAAQKLGQIKRKINIPLVADIHFDWRLALEAINQGVDKIRINPGNIEKREYIERIIQTAKKARIAVRIGVNAGSLKALHITSKTVSQRAQLMVSAALKHIALFEKMNFYDLVVSLKSSDVLTTIEAYKLMTAKSNYPLHLGITEAGTNFAGTIKSAVGLGSLLTDGIGDTIRVSLTDSPVEEVRVGYEILKALGLRRQGPEIISCPTCGRCEIDIIKIARQVEKQISPRLAGEYKKPLKVAIMGCVVNGPGEAREADIGVAGGRKFGLLFRDGKIIKRVPEKDLVKVLVEEIKNLKKGY
ncbi:MAG: flavodoxin-dependent (E)-4-hydroxy-3-methylbut-2-enyl-diphosphate synthase [bacterium]